MNISYNAVMWAGLSVLMAGAVTVSAVTLYKNIQQGKQLEKLNTNLQTIENNNLQSVRGLTDRLDVQSEEQKKANKKNNPKLISAQKDVEEAQKKLDNLKLAYDYIKDEFPTFLDQLVAVAAGNLDVDSSWLPFLAGPDALAGGVGHGIQNMADLVTRIADAAGKRKEEKMVAGITAAHCYGILNNIADVNAAPAPAGAALGTVGLKHRSKAAAADAVKAAEKDLADKKAVVVAIEAALD